MSSTNPKNTLQDRLQDALRKVKTGEEAIYALSVLRARFEITEETLREQLVAATETAQKLDAERMRLIATNDSLTKQLTRSVELEEQIAWVSDRARALAQENAELRDTNRKLERRLEAAEVPEKIKKRLHERGLELTAAHAEINKLKQRVVQLEKASAPATLLAGPLTDLHVKNTENQ